MTTRTSVCRRAHGTECPAGLFGLGIARLKPGNGAGYAGTLEFGHFDSLLAQPTQTNSLRYHFTADEGSANC